MQQHVLCQLAVVSLLLIAAVSARHKKYYESCTQTADCVPPFECLLSVCNCTANHTVSSDSRLCLKGVSYGEPCRETVQCLLKLPDTYCGDSNKCECAPGYDYNTTDNKCSTIVDSAVAHGGNCRLNRQCKSGMVCEGQICECRSGLHWDRASDSCIHDIDPKACSSNQDCNKFKDTECKNGRCECKSGFQLKNDPQKGDFCSAGAGLRSVVAVILLNLLLSKAASW